MGFLDKIKSKATTMAEKANDVIKETKEDMGQYKEEVNQLKQPTSDAIVRYEVIYQGGLIQYPKEKSGAIGLNITPNAFVLKKTIGSKDWFEDFEIPYDSVQSFSIIKRQAGNWEMMLSSDSASARATEVENVLAITYFDADNHEVQIRLEMLTGFTVYNQAKTCRDMLDILRQNNILSRLNKNADEQKNSFSSADELKKYKELLDSGIISQEEFDAKKKQLLGI